jgi:hypothetical protein
VTAWKGRCSARHAVQRPRQSRVTDNTKSIDSGTVSLEAYVIGFFDLLGQQNPLRRLTQLPDKSNPASMAAARDTLIHIYGAVRGMRKWFDVALGAYERKPLDASLLPEPSQELYAGMNSNPLEFRGYPTR